MMEEKSDDAKPVKEAAKNESTCELDPDRGHGSARNLLHHDPVVYHGGDFLKSAF